MSGELRAIIARAAAQQPLTVAQYMELALQHPVYGYYRRHDPFGARGDFITAPEISQMFGEILGLWCVDYWRKLGRPADIVLCELGPGRGTLLADALRAAAMEPDFGRACLLFLYESNADLRAAQAGALAAYRPQWLERLEDLPVLPTLILANEFFDALPIRQYVRRASGWVEQCIGVDEAGGLCWLAVPAAIGQEGQEGDVLEISAVARNIVQQLTRRIAVQGGALLAIDYGYEIPQGQPTFQALAGHCYADPLRAPGEADLTAHVDFGALAVAARAAGAQPWPLREQGPFFEGLGIVARAAQLTARATTAQRQDIAAALRRLTDSAAMGSLFKVLCVTPLSAPAPAGWE